MRHPAFLTVALIAALSGFSAPVRADEAKAASLAREAEKLMSSGKTDEACEKLAESVSLDPRSATALDLAVCRKKQKRAASAYRAYGLVSKLAKDEKRNDRVTEARNERNRLYLQLARITVNVDDETKKIPGLEIRVDGELLPADKYGKAWESNTGDVSVVVSAPGFDDDTQTIKVIRGQRKTIKIGKLTASSAPQPKVEPKDGPAPKDEPKPKDEEEPDEPEGPMADEHENMRLVVELGAWGGYLFSNITRSDAAELRGAEYIYNSSATEVTRAACANTQRIPGAGDCEAIFFPAHGGLVGGQVFVGWAFDPIFHLGGRAFLAKRFPDGFMFLGGPSVNIRVSGPFWLGASFLIGASEHVEKLKAAEGSVPEVSREFNGGQEVVDIPLDTLEFSEATVTSGIIFGGALEASLAILGASPHAFVPLGEPRGIFSGSLMASLWPMFLGTAQGYQIAVPAGISYRFH